VRLNLEGYRQALHELLSDSIAHAAANYAFLAETKIPVWSGASLATFLPLARRVGFALSVNPVTRSRIPLGERSGSADFVADKDTSEYRFTYATNLSHLVYNEANNANSPKHPSVFYRLLNPGPYRFLPQAAQEFSQFASQVALPSVRPFFVTKPMPRL